MVEIGNKLESEGFDVFLDWYAPGKDTDDFWRDYTKARGRTYIQALKEPAATHVFNFDYHYLSKADTVVLLLPAGKSCHLEFGWAIGKGKKGYILFDSIPERYDIMYKFATDLFMNIEDLIKELNRAKTLKMIVYPERKERDVEDSNIDEGVPCNVE